MKYGTFANAFRAARNQRGDSIARLAKALNVSKTDIRRWENGTDIPHDRIVLKKIFSWVPALQIFEQELRDQTSPTTSSSMPVIIPKARQVEIIYKKPIQSKTKEPQYISETTPISKMGPALRRHRLANKLAQTELCELVDIPQHMISRFERNVSDIPLNLWTKFIELLPGLEKENQEEFNSNDAERIGKIIAKARKEKDWAQEKLAEALGCRLSTIKRWETAERTPTLNEWEELKRILPTLQDCSPPQKMRLAYNRHDKIESKEETASVLKNEAAVAEQMIAEQAVAEQAVAEQAVAEQAVAEPIASVSEEKQEEVQMQNETKSPTPGALARWGVLVGDMLTSQEKELFISMLKATKEIGFDLDTLLETLNADFEKNG